jgi:hypothetical protein
VALAAVARRLRDATVFDALRHAGDQESFYRAFVP